MGNAQSKDRTCNESHAAPGSRTAIPTAEWFAGEFTERWIDWRKTSGQVKDDRKVVTASWAAMGEAEETDPNNYYDIDVMLVVPNSDPKFITPEVTASEEFTIATSGFGCTIKKRHSRLEDELHGAHGGVHRFLDQVA